MLTHVAAVAARGSGRVLIVEGEAGLGKSTLLDAARERTPAHVTRCSAGSDELDLARPFGLWFEALAVSADSADHRRRELAELAARIGPAGGVIDGAPGERFLVQDALLDLIEQLAADAPLLITLDDVQWADSGSIAVLANLTRGVRDLPVGLVVALRPWPRRPDIATMIDRALEHGATHLRLPPLDDAAIHQLVDDVTGAAPGPTLQRMLAAAAGNPFFVRELLLSAQATGRLLQHGDIVELDGADAPAPLHDRILRRISGLPDDAVELMQALAAAGGAVDARDLVDLVGRPAGLRRSLADVPGRVADVGGGRDRGGHRIPGQDRAGCLSRLRQGKWPPGRPELRRLFRVCPRARAG